ncbi:BBE domain-containing protein [Nonomuraea sp. NPDC050547]|uniref:BBE domain-containing protein n=1 Tax=Nonomuraea sp. NPDC050547 TaxID=3364368 RepID=UPI0037B538D5
MVSPEPSAHANAVGHRDAAYMLAVLTPLAGADSAEAHRLLDLLFQDLGPWTAGRFLNVMGYGDNADHELVRTAYEPHDHERLAALKAVHDPTNAFRANYDIPPAR